MPTLSYEHIPLSPSPYGETCYQRGRKLVRDEGVRLDGVIWDADEVLWDWMLNTPRLLLGVPSAIFFKNYGHHEWIGTRPGVFELLWGMRHESLALGVDPDLRIWTSGYPWRMWVIGQIIPGFWELLGDGAPPATASEGSIWAARHPRMFSRPDFSKAIISLVDDAIRADFLRGMAPSVRQVISAHMAGEKIADSGFKIPELAQRVSGKEASFVHARVLVDDTLDNDISFVATGRRAVHVISKLPRTMFRQAPNSVWGRPNKALDKVALNHTTHIADALAEAWNSPEPRIVEARPSAPAPAHTAVRLDFSVDGATIWREWVVPKHALLAASQAQSDPKRLAGPASSAD